MKVGAYAALGSAGSALAWIAVSSLLIDHKRYLKAAIRDAELRRFPGEAGDLSFYRDRRGEGRPLVLIHSVNAAASAMEMRPIFDHYKGRRPVYVLDLPGFGFSARRDREYSPVYYGQIISEFIEKEVIGVRPVDVVALSLGCEFAALAALKNPGRIHSIAMISPTGFGERVIPYSDFRRKSLSVPVWSQAFFDLLTSRPSLRYYLAKSFGRGRVPAELLQYAFDTSHQAGARFAPLYFLGGQLFTPSVRKSAYNALKLPVKVLFDRDGYVGFDYVDGYVGARENWSAARIEGTFGMPHWEKPKETFAVLDEFFEG